MYVAVNFLLFQLGWFACVIGAARGLPEPGIAAVVAAVAIHLRYARHPLEECLLLLACVGLGTAFDSLLVASGWVSYTTGMFSAWIAPYWIIAMWALFATTLNVSLRRLRGHSAAAALLGLFGGPLAYFTGAKLGAIELVNPPLALAALGLGWAALMPVLVRLSASLDGMPGHRQGITARYPS